MDAADLTVQMLANDLDENPQRLKDILRGKTRFPAELVVEIQRVYGVRSEWWLHGEGEMFLGDSIGARVERRHVKKRGQFLPDAEEAERGTVTASDGRQIVVLPRYDVRISAGGGSTVHSEQIVDYLSFSRAWYEREVGIPPSQAALFEVHGNSMEPDLHDGDLAVIDLSKTSLKSPAIYVILEGDELRVKKVTLHPDGAVEIRSSNESYGAITLTPEQAEQIVVVGRARRAFPRMRRLP